MVANNSQLILAGNTLGTLDQLPEVTCSWLRNADLVIFEEDRPGRQTLKKAGIHRDYLKYNEHKSSDTLEELEAALRRGETVLYMSDQGMPNIADPGRELVAAAYRLGAQVTVIPGACSITAALAACPELDSRYLFYGFLPRDTEPRRAELATLLALPYPSVILETPYRYKPLIEDLKATAPASRKVLLAVDIAGPEQGFHWLAVKELERFAEDIHKKLNFVIVLGPGPKQASNTKAPSKKPLSRKTPGKKLANRAAKRPTQSSKKPRR